MAHSTRVIARGLTACAVALGLPIVAAASAAAAGSDAVITINFTSDCTGFTATSTKEISNVVVDGQKIDNVNSPTYTDAAGGAVIETVTVKSGTTSLTQTCTPVAPDAGDGPKGGPGGGGGNGGGGGQGDDAVITIEFSGDCTGFTATSTKEISNVVVDGEKIDNVNSLSYTDPPGGDTIETVTVKSGTASVTETCS